jgi:hypothetical protein
MKRWRNILFFAVLIFMILMTIGCEDKNLDVTNPVAKQDMTTGVVIEGAGDPAPQLPALIETIPGDLWNSDFHQLLPDVCKSDPVYFPETNGQYFDNADFTNLDMVMLQDALGANDFQDHVVWKSRTIPASEIPYAIPGLGIGDDVNLGRTYGAIEMAAPASLPINHNFEEWTNGNPDRWNDASILSGVYLPPIWNSNFFYPSALTSQTTDSKDGNYALYLRTYREGNVMASNWYQIPWEDQKFNASWKAIIAYKGNTGGDLTFSLGYEFLDRDGNELPGLDGSGNVVNNPVTYQFTPNSSTAYADIETDWIQFPTPPAYVRFAVRQERGNSLNYYLTFDDLRLSNGGGDVSLPLTLIDFNITNYQINYYHYLVTNWETASEINNYGFHLYFNHPQQGLIEASPEFVQGLGSDPFGQVYNKTWFLNSTVVTYYNRVPSGTPLEFVMASEDFNGTMHYYQDYSATWVK